MRKITTLLMLLLVCIVGAMAETVNDLSLPQWQTGATITNVSTTPATSITPGFYVIENASMTTLVTYKDDAAFETDYAIGYSSFGINAFKTGGGITLGGASSDRLNFVVKITDSGDGGYHVQFSNGKYLPSFSTEYLPGGLALSNTPGSYNFTLNTGADFFITYGSTTKILSKVTFSSTEYYGNLYPALNTEPINTVWKFYPITLSTGGGSSSPTLGEYDPYVLNVGYKYGSYYRIKNHHTMRFNYPGTPYNGTPVELGEGATASDYGTSYWAYKWVADDASNLTIEVTTPTSATNPDPVNSFYNHETSDPIEYFDTGAPRSWKISVADGYQITSFELTAKIQSIGGSGSTSKGSITIGGETHDFTTTESTWKPNITASSQINMQTKGGSNGTSNAHIVFSSYKITVRKIPTTHTLTLNYSAWDGETPFTVTKEIESGTNVKASDIEIEYYKDFSSDATFPLEMNEDKTINVTCTPDFPFTSGYVYGLKDKYRNYCFEYNTHISRQGALVSPIFNKSTYWTYEHVAGTQNLFTLYNMQEKKYATMTALPTTQVGDGDTGVNNAGYAKFLELTDAPTAWTSGMTPTSHFRITKYDNDYFRMEHPAESNMVASNAHSYSLVVWWGPEATSSNKSAFQVVDINSSLAAAPSLEAEHQTIVSDYVTSQSVTRFTNEAKALLSLVVDGTANPTKSNIAQIIDGFTSVPDQFGELVDENAIYQIIFTRGDNVMGMYNAEADKDGVASTEKEIAKPMTALQDTEVNSQNMTNTLWRFVKNGSRFNIQHVNGNLYLANFMDDAEDGSRAYISSTHSQAAAVGFDVEGNGTDVWAIRNPESTWQKSGSGAYRQFFNSSYQTAATGAKTHYVGAYTTGISDDGSKLKIKKISSLPLAVSAAGWTAFCFPVNVTVPEGVTVYQATSGTNSALHLEEVAAGTVLPAGVGFLCQAAEGTYDFTITKADAADFSDNLLAGATLKRTGMTAGDFYALANKANGVGFYQVNATTVPANKAFLKATTLPAGAREMLDFHFGEETGINAFRQSDDTSVLFDLNGRRIYYPVRGIYVTASGKKIFLNK